MFTPLPPPQESFESVFSLQRRVEPDQDNHITSCFSVLDINNTLGNLDIYASHSRSKRHVRKNTGTAQSHMYKGNMSCFSLVNTTSDFGPHAHTLSLPTTPRENYALAGASIAILNDSRVANQLSNPSTTTPPSSIYSHSLLQPIRKAITANQGDLH